MECFIVFDIIKCLKGCVCHCCVQGKDWSFQFCKIQLRKDIPNASSQIFKSPPHTHSWNWHWASSPIANGPLSLSSWMPWWTGLPPSYPVTGNTLPTSSSSLLPGETSTSSQHVCTWLLAVSMGVHMTILAIIMCAHDLQCTSSQHVCVCCTCILYVSRLSHSYYLLGNNKKNKYRLS